MAQIGNKEMKQIQQDIERGDYDLEKCMSLRIRQCLLII